MKRKSGVLTCHHLVDLLRGEIENTPVGAKLASLRALASRFGVSPTTMSQALMILAHAGRIRPRHGSGFYVCEQRAPRHIGVLMEVDLSFSGLSNYWRSLTQQVRLRLAAQGLRSRLYAGFCEPDTDPGFTKCPELLEDVEQDRLLGMIVTYGSPRREWTDTLRKRRVPVVGYWPAFDHYVRYDYATATRAATESLLAAGRRKLAFMDWAEPRRARPQRDELFEAFKATLAEHGAAFDPRWVRREFHPNQPGAGWEEFREIWMAGAEKPDGLIVADDVLFGGVVNAIGQLSIRVPEQLRVVTHSQCGAPEDYPFPVWRMETDAAALAGAQVDLLAALLRREPVPEPQVRVPMRFVAPDLDAGETREPEGGRAEAFAAAAKSG
jgi:DNA-binding LacI/PurR family transcriptional regulator